MSDTYICNLHVVFLLVFKTLANDLLCGRFYSITFPFQCRKISPLSTRSAHTMTPTVYIYTLKQSTCRLPKSKLEADPDACAGINIVHTILDNVYYSISFVKCEQILLYIFADIIVFYYLAVQNTTIFPSFCTPFLPEPPVSHFLPCNLFFFAL